MIFRDSTVWGRLLRGHRALGAYDDRNHRGSPGESHPRRARPLPHPDLRQSAAAAAHRARAAAGEGVLTDRGAFTAITAPHTGRSAKDKFLVEDPTLSDRIWWEKNVRLESAAFDRLQEDVRAYLDAREVFVQDLFAGADPAYRLPVRFITPNAWHSLFVRNMFIRALPAELAQFRPGFTVLHAPELPGRSGAARDPDRHLRGAQFRQASWC